MDGLYRPGEEEEEEEEGTTAKGVSGAGCVANAVVNDPHVHATPPSAMTAVGSSTWEAGMML